MYVCMCVCMDGCLCVCACICVYICTSACMIMCYECMCTQWTCVNVSSAREAIAVMDFLCQNYGYESTGESFGVGDATEGDISHELHDWGRLTIHLLLLESSKFVASFSPIMVVVLFVVLFVVVIVAFEVPFIRGVCPVLGHNTAI